MVTLIGHVGNENKTGTKLPIADKGVTLMKDGGALTILSDALII
jgi:hypothetical protein